MLDENSTSTQQEEPQAETRRSLFGWKLGAVAVVCIIAIIYSSIDEKKPSPSAEELAYQSYVDNFDERLLTCNEVLNAKPTESFDTCQAAANDGLIHAQKRMVWAYARNGEYQDWQEVFNWLKTIRARDNETQLLLLAILHLMADTDKLKKESELGIKQLVTKNYPPANVFLASIYALEQNLLPKTSNASWLLKRTFDQRPELIDPMKLATIYEKGWLGTPNIGMGTQVLKTSAEKRFPQTTNNVAWFLSTLEDNPFTEAEYALSLAKRVVEHPEFPENAENPIYVDTLAATYAANQLFDDAISTQKKALELLNSSEINEQVKEKEIIEYTKRLNLYESKEALVETYVTGEKEQVFKSIRADIVDYLFSYFSYTIELPQPINTSNNQ